MALPSLSLRAASTAVFSEIGTGHTLIDLLMLPPPQPDCSGMSAWKMSFRNIGNDDFPETLERFPQYALQMTSSLVIKL